MRYLLILFLALSTCLLFSCKTSKYLTKHKSTLDTSWSRSDSVLSQYADTIETRDTFYVHHYEKIPCPDLKDSVQRPDDILIHDLQYVHDTILVENMNKISYQNYQIDSLKNEYKNLSLQKVHNDKSDKNKTNWLYIVLGGIVASLTLYLKQKLKHK